MGHYFCLLKPTRSDMHGNLSEGEAEIFAEHTDYLKRLFEKRQILQAGTSFEAGEEGFAIVILKATHKREAVALMDADPAVARGLLLAKVTEYRIFLDRSERTAP